LARHLQEATGTSIKRVIRALKPLQDVTINLNGHHLTAQPQLTQTAAGILKHSRH
ncbi:transposase, partial [Actinomyces oris]